MIANGGLQYGDSFRTSRGQVSRVAAPARRNSHEDSRREVSSTVFGISGALCGSSGFLMRARFGWDPSFVWNRGSLLCARLPALPSPAHNTEYGALLPPGARARNTARETGGEAARRPPPNRGVESLPGDLPDRIQAGHEVHRSTCLSNKRHPTTHILDDRGTRSGLCQRSGIPRIRSRWSRWRRGQPGSHEVSALSTGSFGATHRLRDQGAFGPRTQRTNTGDPVSWRP